MKFRRTILQCSRHLKACVRWSGYTYRVPQIHCCQFHEILRKCENASTCRPPQLTLALAISSRGPSGRMNPIPSKSPINTHFDSFFVLKGSLQSTAVFCLARTRDMATIGSPPREPNGTLNSNIAVAAIQWSLRNNNAIMATSMQKYSSDNNVRVHPTTIISQCCQKHMRNEDQTDHPPPSCKEDVDYHLYMIVDLVSTLECK